MWFHRTDSSRKASRPEQTTSRRTSAERRRGPGRRSLRMEPLEDRRLLAIDAFIGSDSMGNSILWVFDDSQIIGTPNQLQDNEVSLSTPVAGTVRVEDPLGVFTNGSASASGPGYAEFDTADFTHIHIDLQNGDDTFTFDSSFSDPGLADIVVNGGDPSGSDVLILEAPGVAQSVTIAPANASPGQTNITGYLGTAMHVHGYETIGYVGSGNDDLTVDLGNANDTARVEGSFALNRDIVTSSSLPRVEFLGVDAFVLEDGGGIETMTFYLPLLRGASSYEVSTSPSDTVVFEGNDNSDDWEVTSTGLDDTTVADNDPIDGTDSVHIVGEFASLQLDTFGGDDLVTIDNSTGLVQVPIQFNGGEGADTLQLTGSTAVTTAEYTPGPTSDAGTILHEDAPNEATQTIAFTGLEPVLDNVAATDLTVNGTGADNAISYTAGPGGGIFGGDDTGLVAVDGFETYEFSNKETLILNGLGGSDTISLNNPATPTGLTGITVDGGDPTGSDTLIVNGRDGVDDLFDMTPTGPGAGMVGGAGPSVTFSAAEHLVIVGQSADNDYLDMNAPAGAGTDSYEYTPGAVVDAGYFTGFRDGAGGFSYTPLRFEGIRDRIVVGGVDSLIANGTSADDSFVFADDVLGVSLVVSGHTEIYMNSDFTLRGLGGNDSFTMDYDPSGGFAGFAIDIQGGDSDGSSDTLHYVATANAAVDIDLETSLITQTGPAGNPVTFSGLERVDITANNATITVTGTAGDDTVRVAPTTSGAGGFTANGANTQFDFSGAAGFTVVGGAGGDDTVQIVGRDVADTVTSPAANAVNVNGSTVTVGAGVERLEIHTLAGDDTVTLGLSLAGVAKVIYAGEGDDTVDLTTTADATVFGGAGDDVIVGTALADYLSGDEGNDTISGLAGDDVLLGGDDFDIINPGTGTDTVDGGGSEDWLLITTAATAIDLRESAGRLRVDHAGNVVLASSISQALFASTGVGVTTTVLDLSGTGVDRVGIDFFGGGTDTLVVEGSNVSENIAVGRDVNNPNGDPLAFVSLGWGRVGAGIISAAEGDRIVVRGRDGDDVITADEAVMNAALIPGSIGSALVTLEGGNGDDVLTVDSPAGQVGNAIIGGAGDDTLIGGLGDDQFDGEGGDDRFLGNGGTDAVGGGAAGAIGDTILVPGTAGDDVISLALDASGFLLVTVNGQTTTYTNFIGGPIAAAGIEKIEVDGLAGDDTLTVDVGLVAGVDVIPIPIDFHGGFGADALLVVGTPATAVDEVIYAPGPSPDAGRLIYEDVGNTTLMAISFDGLEPVVDLVLAANLTVFGTSADNAIQYRQGANSGSALVGGATTGEVRIDNFETIEFANKTALTIRGQAGADAIALTNSTVPASLTSITVNGDAPVVDGDTVELNGTNGNDTFTYTASAANAGTIVQGGAIVMTYNLSNIEGLTLNGRTQAGSDTLAVTTANAVITPGSDPGTGRIDPVTGPGAPLLALDFLDIESATVTGTTAVITGTDENDTITVSSAGIVTVTNELGFNNSIDVSGFTGLVINALGGDDDITIAPGALFANGISVLGGDNGGGSDSLTIADNNPAINFLLNQITQVVGGPISLDGVEHLTLNGADGVADAFTVSNYGASTDVVDLVLNAGDAGGADEADDISINTASLGADTLRYTPQTRFTSTLTRAEGGPTIHIAGFRGHNEPGRLTLAGGAGGDDRLEVYGGASPDAFTVRKLSASQTLVEMTLAAGTGGAEPGISVDIGNMEAIAVFGDLGDDTLTMAQDPVFGLVTLLGGVTFHGGTGLDSLAFAGATTVAATYTVGPNPDEGSITHVNVASGETQRVDFTGLEPVFDATPGPLTIAGTNADNTISYTQGSVPANGQVAVDGFEAYEFTNKTTLTINALGGSDQISLNNPTTPAGLTTITVNGGDPTASDTLIVNGTTAGEAIAYDPSDTPGEGSVAVAGLPVVDFTTIEAVKINGQGGIDALTVTTPATVHQVTYTPGSASDAGTIAIRQAGNGVALVPLTFSQIGAGGSVTFASVGGREDVLELNGTNDSDVFFIDGTADTVQIQNPTGGFVTTLLNTDGISWLEARGLNGDDTFNITGEHPYFNGVFIDGGSPDASDVINFAGSATVANGITVDLGGQTVSEATFSPVSYLGVEVVNVNANGHGLSVVATADDDDLKVTVLSATSGRVERGPAVQKLGEVLNPPTAPVVNYTDLAAGTALAVDLAGGEDSLIVVGNALSQTFNVNANPAAVAFPAPYGAVPGNTVQVDDGNDGALDGAVVFTNNESVQVYGLEGNDTFNVAAGPIPVFVDGGDPIGDMTGDTITVVPNGNPVAFEPGPENDEGGFLVGVEERISFDHIEAIGPIVGAPCVLIVGTFGDDDITVIARSELANPPQFVGADGVQDFTTSVNGGPQILWIDTPNLYIDALAGDDDVVIRSRAPNEADWDVNVRIVGGPPSAATGDQGDVVEVETPGSAVDSVVYTATGADTGELLIDEDGDGVYSAASTDTLIQIVANFVIDCNDDGVNEYRSSDGGAEELVYDGEGGAGGDDQLTVVGTALDDTILHTPGAGNEEGTFRVNELLAISYQNMGPAAILTASGAGGTDTLEVLGTLGSDAFDVADATGAVALNDRLVIAQTSIEQLVLEALEGDDSFVVSAGHPYASVTVQGGGPGASDVLTVNGVAGVDEAFVVNPDFANGDGDVTVNAVPVLYTGIEHVLMDANAGDTDTLVINDDLADNTWNVLGGPIFGDRVQVDARESYDYDDFDTVELVNRFGTDLFNVWPTALVGFNTSLTVTGDGDDTMAAHGTPVVDTITSAPGGGAQGTVTVNSVDVLFGGLESVELWAGEGDDTINVTPLAGVVTVVQAGGPAASDVLNVAVTANARVTQGATSTSGTVDQTGAGDVDYYGVERLNIASATAGSDLTVRGTDDHDTIAVGLVGITAVWINDGTVVNYNPAGGPANFDLVTVQGRFGDDQFSVTPHDGVDITVQGGDPTDDDTVVVNGTAAADAVTVSAFATESAEVQVGALGLVTVQTVDGLTFNGLGGNDDLTVVAGDFDEVDYTPDTFEDAGAIAISDDVFGPDQRRLPFNFRNLGAGGSLVVDSVSGAANLHLRILGTAIDDRFEVSSGPNGTVQVFKATSPGFFVTLPISAPGVDSLFLVGLDGSDTFNVAGDHQFARVIVEGGNPDNGSDVLNFNGAGAAVAVDLDARTVTETGFGPVLLSGIETANIAAATGDLTVSATADDDELTYTPTGVDAGNFQNAGDNTKFNFTAVGTFTVDTLDDDGDIVIVRGTNNHDVISVDSPARTVSVENVSAVVLQPVVLADTVESVTVQGRLGSDTIVVVPALGVAGLPLGNLLVYVDGGPPGASDALVIAADINGGALAATDFVVINKGRNPNEGVVRVFRDTAGAGNAPTQLPDISYTDVEIVSPQFGVLPANAEPNLLVLGPDMYEENEFINVAAFIGSGPNQNVTDLAIFPNVEEHRYVPADIDWYRFVPQITGTLDIQVYFQDYSPELLPAGGDIDIELYDVDGTLIAGSVNPLFGSNEAAIDADERIRVPVVAGQTYYLRVFGGLPETVNGYDMTVVNMAPAVPYDLELDDFPPNGTTNPPGQSDNSDTGRSQFDNVTYDNTPTIRFRLDDALFLHDLPGNPTDNSPPDQVTRIPFNPTQTAVPGVVPGEASAAGFRVAIYDEGDPQQPGQLPQVLIGYARQIVEGVYEFDFAVDALGAPYVLTDGSHFLSAKVEIIDPADPTEIGYGARSVSLEIVVDIVPPPVAFGFPAVPDDGLHPDSDTGIEDQPGTFTDNITSDTTPTFWGIAEANSIIRVYADVDGDGALDPDVDVQLGMTVALPYDGTNQYPEGYWELTSAIDLNDPAYFPVIDGVRTIFATAEDLAGNINPADLAEVLTLDIFIDTRGPQVEDVVITDDPDYDLFDPKPSTDGPTPVTTSLDILFVDRPPRGEGGAAATGYADIIVVMDESGSMAGEHAFIGPFIQTLDAQLAAAGIGGGMDANQFGLVGFGNGIGGSNNGRSFLIGGSLFGSSADFATATGGLVLSGGTEDGYAGVDYALDNYTFRAGSERIIILVTDEDRDNEDAALNFNTVFTSLDAEGVALVTINDVDLRDGIDTTALAVDSDGIAYIEQPMGAFVQTGGGYANSAFGTTIDDYVELAWDLGGFAADLNQLRDGGNTALSFSNALVDGIVGIAAGGFLYPAVNEVLATTPGNIVLVGDANGVIPIRQIEFIDNTVPGGLGHSTVRLHFYSPLPDDRYTLTVSDHIQDDAGNALDGESNAIEPQEAPFFPSGDGNPGGDFIARFTIDTRPEIGVWAAGSVSVDTNGNFHFDPTNVDYTNRDIVYKLGFTSDDIFAGNFAPAAVPGAAVEADGFDKLAAYGLVGSQYRWLIDVNNDGIVDPATGDIVTIQGPNNQANNGLPFAGNFDGDALNGDEVGFFNSAGVWWFDTDHDFVAETPLAGSFLGYPMTGDFNGDGVDDLATWANDVFYIDLSDPTDLASPIATLPGIYGVADVTFTMQQMGFIGTRERPVAADMDMDGFADLGLWTPDRAHQGAAENGEWYWLLSGNNVIELEGLDPADWANNAWTTLMERIVPDPIGGFPVINFTPVPFGDDLFASFGDEFGIPVVGNFDPPVTNPTALTVAGTAAAEVFEITGGATPQLKINGVVQTVLPGIRSIDLTGLGANDSVVVIGTAGDEQIDLGPDGGTVRGANYRVSFSFASVGDVDVVVLAGGGNDEAVLTGTAGSEGFTANKNRFGDNWLVGTNLSLRVYDAEDVTVDGNGGSDSAWLYDTAGDDRFIASPHSGTLSGAGYSVTVDGFNWIRANASAGNDTGIFRDSAGDDTFWGRPTLATLDSGAAYSLIAGNFDKVEVQGSGQGYDVGLLYGGAQDETMTASPSAATLKSATYENSVTLFDYVAAAGKGGYDQATLTDSAGYDVFQGNRLYGRLAGERAPGEGYLNRAYGFDKITAISTAGDDQAKFDDTDGNEVYTGTSLEARIVSTKYAYDHTAAGFAIVKVIGGAGGHDVAQLYDSTRNDTFIGGTAVSKLYGPGYLQWVQAFQEVYAESSAGGYDTALLNDTAGDDLLEAADDWAKLSSGDLALTAKSFSEVQANRSSGSDVRRLNAVDFLLTSGDDWLNG